MPDLDWNRSTWDGTYGWVERGDEWSATWGGSAPQWHGSIAPRLNRRLPARAILEVAPGYGRWTRYLLPLCQEFSGIDLSAECVVACQERFRAAPHARFLQNDGLSLAGVPEDHFDLVFTYDSLVHAEADVMDSYVTQILHKLNLGGVAFVHHSNLAALPGAQNPHYRAATVSAETVARAITQAGGKVLVQERINWGGQELNDCFTLFARGDHPDQLPAAQMENRRYMEEAALIRENQAAWHRCAAEELRRADAARKARGRWARLRAAWRGR